MPLFSTVAEAIARVGELYPQNAFTFQDLRGNEVRYGFVELEKQTASRAAMLQQRGVRKGDRIGLIVIEPEDFVLTFLAALRIGVVPVPLYPPLSFGNLDAYAERTAKVLASSTSRILVASSKLQNVLWSMVDRVDSLQTLLPVENLRENTSEQAPDYPEITPDDLAFLQYTSGSTADPKGVMVTHGSLIANSEGIIREGLQLNADDGDTGVSWLPLYHDMGLIGFVIAPICTGVNSVFIPTLRFIKKPSVWMDTIHRHRGTASFAPNFAYALATRRIKDADLEKWDLSCLRVLGCGAEPIRADTMRAFTSLFHDSCGMPKNVIMPAYGMAEATLAITLNRAPEAMVTVQIDADHFSETGEARNPEGDVVAVEHVGCGRAFDGHEVAIMGPDGSMMADGNEGEIVHAGPSVTPGYFENPTETAKAYRGKWLHTGDLGFIQEGELFVTGRIKDLIIINGRNVHPQAIEWTVGEVEHIRKGNVVAFSVPGPTGEQLVVVAETKKLDLADEIRKAIRLAIQREFSLVASDIVLLRSGSLPKTSSGKLQRRKTRDQYMGEELGEGGSRAAGSNASKITLAKHVAKSVWSRAKAAVR